MNNACIVTSWLVLSIAGNLIYKMIASYNYHVKYRDNGDFSQEIKKAMGIKGGGKGLKTFTNDIILIRSCNVTFSTLLTHVWRMC